MANLVFNTSDPTAPPREVDYAHGLPVTILGPSCADLISTAAALSDAAANPTTTMVGADISVWNGTTWDRVRRVDIAEGAATAIGVIAAGGVGFDHANAVYRVFRQASRDGETNGFLQGVGNELFNGATWDRQRGNYEVNLLAGAARTATTNTTTQTVYNARGVLLILDVTVASGTGGLTVRYQAIDVINSGNKLFINAAPTAITAIGTYGYLIYPGASAAGVAGTGNIQQVTSSFIPRSGAVNVAHGDASSYTYSITASFLV